MEPMRSDGLEMVKSRCRECATEANPREEPKMLVKCEECRTPVSSEAISCPRCGVPRERGADHSAYTGLWTKEIETLRKRSFIVCGGIVAFHAILLFVGMAALIHSTYKFYAFAIIVGAVWGIFWGLLLQAYGRSLAALIEISQYQLARR